jgi:serine-type D-Ala-D-Ala carboxypeptidase/endopeptidase
MLDPLIRGDMPDRHTKSASARIDSPDELRVVVTEIVSPLLVKHKAASVAIAAVTPHAHAVLAFGPVSNWSTPPGDLIYEIGSVTKVLTTSLLADLIREGELSLDDPVQRFLPPNVRMPSYGETEITLEHLATHTSGLPRLPKNLKLTRATRSNPYAAYTVDQLYEFLSRHRLSKKPPTRVGYSNLGAGVLGHVLANVMGTDYERAVRERICIPLGMCDTVMTLSEEQEQRLVPGHTSRGKPTPLWDVPTLAGAGALRSTAHDMLRFLSAQMGSMDHPVTESLAMCHRPRAVISKELQVGLGWMIVNHGTDRLLWHNGGTGGFNCYIGFLKEKGVGVCVLANRGPSLLSLFGLGPPLAEGIGFRILKSLSE